MNMGIVCILIALAVVHVTTASIVNVAQGKPVSMSSSKPGFSASTAVDGKTEAGGYGPGQTIDTVDGHPFAWWKVDLQREVQNTTVRIYFRTDYKRTRNGVKLYTSTSQFSTSNPTSQGQLCRNVTGRRDGSDIPDVYNVTCPGRWRYLLLYTDTDNDGRGPILDFGEVEVFVCSDGTYGEDCNNFCSSRKCVTMTTRCERDGICPDGCQSGWTGVDCRQALPPCTNIKYYGLNCDRLCSDRKCITSSPSSCDRLTGRCPGGCDDGWREADCAQECDFGFYGPGCSLSCSNRKCKEPATECDHVTGQCRGCKPGYKGIDCVEECESGTYGNCSLSCNERNCLVQSAECNHVTGQCEDGCQAGYQGIDCRQECDLGVNYGVNCIKSCTDRHCNKPLSECDTRTGQCINGCQVGWTGMDCSSQCPAGTFGSGCTSCTTRHCQGESDCPADGTCSQGCQDGWTGNTCLEECSRGVFGPGCSITCGNCSSNYACHHVSGKCPSGCKAGWRTEMCNEVCSEDTYGPGCTEKCGKCDGVCDSVDGRCPAGCLDGYCGIKCDLALFGADVNGKELACFDVASLVGAVVGTFMMVVLLAVGIHIYLIRQGRLQWIKTSEAKKSVQVSRDFTQMSSIAARPADVSENAQPGNQVHNNDYAVLDTGQMQGNKDYDVIQPKHYLNL